MTERLASELTVTLIGDSSKSWRTKTNIKSHIDTEYLH